MSKFLGPEHCYWLVFISFLTTWFTRWWITHGWIQGGALELHKSGLTIVFLLTSSNLANWGTTLNFIHYSYKYHLTITNNSYWSHLHQRLSHGWSFETPRTFGQEAFSAGPREWTQSTFWPSLPRPNGGMWACSCGSKLVIGRDPLNR